MSTAPRVTEKPIGVVVLGPAGVGKSTYINSFTGANLRVSDNLAEDGTLAATLVSSGKCRIVDTVGLDSVNAQSSPAKVRKLLDNENVTAAAVILVCRYDADRITSWIEEFSRQILSLFSSPPTVLVYWRGSCETRVTKHEQMNQAMNKKKVQLIHFDSDAQLRLDVAVQHAKPLKVNIPSPAPQSTLPSANKTKARVALNVPKAIPSHPLQNTSMATPEFISKLLTDVLAIEKSNHKRYEHLCHLGDARYKEQLIMYSELVLKKEVEDIRDFADDRVRRTVQASALKQLMNLAGSHLPPKVRTDVLENKSDHGQADVLEAMVGLTRSDAKKANHFRIMRRILHIVATSPLPEDARQDHI